MGRAVIPLIIPGDSAPLCLSSIHTLINIIIIIIIIIIIAVIAVVIIVIDVIIDFGTVTQGRTVWWKWRIWERKRREEGKGVKRNLEIGELQGENKMGAGRRRRRAAN